MHDTLPTFELEQTLSGGFHFPARATVLPLRDGGLAVISPLPSDEVRDRALAALGEVRYLIAPNLLHHLYLGEASRRHPQARVLAPAALRAKRPDLRIDAALEDGLPEPLAAAVDLVPVRGAPTVDEFAFHHRASRTLVLTDLVFHVTRPRGLVANVVLFLVGCRGKLAQSRAWRFFVKDEAAARASAEALLALPFETLVVAHGDIVTTHARARLEAALAPMLGRATRRLAAGAET